MQGKGDAMKVFKTLNVLCGLLCACMLDSESWVPAIILAVNVLIFTAPLVYDDIKGAIK